MTSRSAPRRQTAKVSLRIGRRAELTVGVKLTSSGILAVAVLVPAILVSTAALVRVAARGN